ncbi:MAG TPA: hypothetical protein VNV64_01335, partial [Candidatus Binatia bacterium]|nr:hypothetical protein [Candidatus Binatia bacterium]
MKASTCCIAFLISASWAGSSLAQPNADFTKANEEYAQGHFTEAISGYEALVSAGQWSANLFYDLGN